MNSVAKRIVEVGMEDSLGQVPQCRKNSSSGNILLMEGEPGMARRCRKFLEWEEFSVIVAADKEIALRLLQDPAVHINLIVANVKLLRDEMSRFARQAKELAPSARILLMSTTRGCERSETDFQVVEMPFYPETLVQKVMQLLGGSPRLFRTINSRERPGDQLMQIGQRLKASWNAPLK